MKILLTGVAGFIGMHTAKRLLERGDEVIGVDNLNPYYAVTLKQARLDCLSEFPAFSFHKLDIADRGQVADLVGTVRPQAMVHLAAQAGVGYSIHNPAAYVESNLVGFANILEACRHASVSHLVYASSSSVYGTNREMPLAVADNTDHPISLYAATKKANEVMAHAYSHLFQIPMTGLRFFTVYGPWGRPDMAPFLFTRAILEGRPIRVFNYGNMSRDFTYVDDVVDGVVRVLDQPPSVRLSASGSPLPRYRLYNIGNHQPVRLLRLIEVIEQALGTNAIKELLPMQPGDVQETCADVADLVRDVGYAPSTPIEIGMAQFVRWYLDYFHVPGYCKQSSEGHEAGEVTRTFDSPHNSAQAQLRLSGALMHGHSNGSEGTVPL